MYWPTAAARVLSAPPPINSEEITTVKPSKRGNLFVTLSDTSIGVWDTRPTVLQAVIIRTKESVERWGHNTDVTWTSDGRGLIVVTSTSHLIVYDIVPTGTPAYESVPTAAFPPGGGAGEGNRLMGYELRLAGVAFVMGRCQDVVAQPHNLILSLQHPPALLSVPFPIPPQLLAPPGSHFPPHPLDGDTEEQVEVEIWDMGMAPWMDLTDGVPVPKALTATRVSGLPVTYSLLTDDGRVYVLYSTNQLELLRENDARSRDSPWQSPSQRNNSKFTGQLVYPIPQPSTSTVAAGIASLGLIEANNDQDASPTVVDKAVTVAVNGKLGWVAVGTASGLIHIIMIPAFPRKPRTSHTFNFKQAAALRAAPGAVTSLAWTSDGYALAAGYDRGCAIWSMGGRLGGWGAVDQDDGEVALSSDAFMNGVSALFWAPGNLDLFMLASDEPDRLYVMPFVKSATTSQHSPDNTRYAFLQMDDRVLVYRGADQPDMSVINPESDVWQHIHIPNVYIATNWPIRYASISSDGRFIAVAGRRGLTHYSAASGRWKLFGLEREERAFTVRGGLLWFHHVLIAAVEVDKKYQIRLYSRDLDLSESNILHTQKVPSQVLVMTLLDNSLLVYTADSMLYHFLILPTRDSIRIQLCGSIGFQGLITVPSRVRALSWLLPEAQKRLGDPADDLVIATIIFLVDERLVLLRPRKAGTDEVRYDKQILADRIESYWTHLHGVGTLENSLWGYDGRSMRVWLDALTIEGTRVDTQLDTYENVKESINLRLDFYPLSILMDKGIMIGVDYEISTRTLPFVLFKTQTSAHLFLPQFLRYHLDSDRLKPALLLARHYRDLVYFGHALEVLLHSVLEDTVDALDSATKLESKSAAESSDEGGPDRPESSVVSTTAATATAAAAQAQETLSLVARFLDAFPQSLDVVVGCARKTELEHWGVLFDVVGTPRELYERCLAAGQLRTAASYLLVMHTLELDAEDDLRDTVRLLRQAMEANETQLCKELLRFLRSIDESGAALKAAVEEVGILRPSVSQPAV